MLHCVGILLFRWAGNFAPIASAIQLLNWDILYLNTQGTAEEHPLSDVVKIPSKIKIETIYFNRAVTCSNTAVKKC